MRCINAVIRTRSNHEGGPNMGKRFFTILAAVALSLDALVPQAMSDPTVPNAASDPAPQACRGQFISTVVQSPLGPGRRTVAERFFGDQPQAVREAEQAIKAS